MTTGETRVSDDVKVDAVIWSCQTAGWWLARSHLYQPSGWAGGYACHMLTASTQLFTPCYVSLVYCVKAWSVFLYCQPVQTPKSGRHDVLNSIAVLFLERNASRQPPVSLRNECWKMGKRGFCCFCCMMQTSKHKALLWCYEYSAVTAVSMWSEPV